MANQKNHISKLKEELQTAKQTITSLTKTKLNFELLVNNINEFVWLMNSNFEFTFVSPTVQKLLGYSENEFIEQEIISPLILEFKHIILNAKKKQSKVASEIGAKKWITKVKHKNSTHVWIESSTNLILDDKSNFAGIIGVSRDISTQIALEQKMLENEVNLKAQIDNTTDSIWSIDDVYCIKALNNTFKNNFKQAFGIKLKPGISILNALPEPFREQWKHRYNKALNGEIFTVTDHFEFNGVPQYVEVNFNPIRLSNRVIGVSVFSRDITKQKTIEKNLIESEKKYKSLIDNIPSVSYRCLYDNHWTMKFISNEIENLTGYKADHFLNNNLLSYSNIIHTEDQEYVYLFVKEKLEAKQSYSLEYRIFDKWNNIKWVHERGRGQYNEKGDIEFIDGVISDITLRKKSEQELQKNEQHFRILSDATIDMLSFNSTSEILTYVANILGKQFYKTTIVAQSLVNINTLEINHVGGYKATNVLLKLNQINVEPIKLSNQQINSFKNFDIIKSNSNLLGINKEVAAILKKEIPNYHKSNIYSIGILKEKELLGILHFITLTTDIDENKPFIESFANITGILLHRQQLIESIHNSEEKFRSLFENTSSVITIITPQKVLLANRAFCNLLGYNEQEFLKLNPSDLIHPNQKEITMNQINQWFNHDEVPGNSLIHLIDKYFNEKWIDISSTIIKFDGKKAALIVGSDITERRNADLELNKYSTGIINSPSSIVITDIDGTIEYVNPYFSEVTGYSFDEAIGNNSSMLSSGNNPKEVYIDMWDTILKGDVWNGELQNKTKQGNIYWEAARIAPIFDEGGIITNFIAIKADITQRKRNLELIKKSEKDLREINAKKDKFFSIIAHDLRSPFSGLSGLAQILKSSLNELSNDEIGKYIDHIYQSTQNISKLLENLLSWAKSQTGKIEFNPAYINLLTITQEITDILEIGAKNKEISITVNINDNFTVYADANMLHTILRNLISNAIKYTPRKGHIKINAQQKTINESVYKIISVTDNGVGIPDNKKSKIFKIEENYTTQGTEKEKGTGLGLILCKEFIEMHHGEIWCKSIENEGATFYISLPDIN